MKVHPVYVVAAIVAAALVLLVSPDPAAAAGALLIANAPAGAPIELLQKAFRDHGLEWKQFTEKQSDTMREFSNRLLDLEQKGTARGGGGGESDGDPILHMAELIVSSDNVKAYLKGASPSTQVTIPLQEFKTAIVNATGQNQPLVQADRRPGVTVNPQRRFTIRDLFSQVRTSGNLIEYVRELVYSNNAGPQYDGSSPTPQTEGAVKNESGITFELANAPVVTLAHWIPASRQVLSDAPFLQRYLNDRLLFGLKLEEEDEIVAGDGTAGTLNGLISQATAFLGGGTNQSALDTLALSIAQLAAGNYMATGFVINPLDWWSAHLRLAKDTQGRYILGNPGEDTEPRLWGLPCAVTNAMTRGKFLTLDAPQTGFIADREDANVRISDQHADFFIRNMVAIRCEERISFVVERPGAIIYGNLSHAG